MTTPLGNPTRLGNPRLGSALMAAGKASVGWGRRAGLAPLRSGLCRQLRRFARAPGARRWLGAACSAWLASRTGRLLRSQAPPRILAAKVREPLIS